MSLLTRFFTVFVLYEIVCYAKDFDQDKRQGKHLFGMLGYIQGFKYGQEYALQLPPFYYPPPLYVFPTVNQQQYVTLQKAIAQESFQEVGPSVQKLRPGVPPARLSAAFDPPKNIENLKDVLRNTKRDTQDDEASSTDLETQSSRKSFKKETTTVSNLNTSESTTTATEGNATESIENTYPTAQNSISGNDDISLTTAATTELEGDTTGTETSVDQSTPPSFAPMTSVIGRYPAALYNIEGVDNLSITSERPSSRVELQLPPTIDQNWKNFATMASNLIPSLGGFKPISGLYYDRFLPLFKRFAGDKEK